MCSARNRRSRRDVGLCPAGHQIVRNMVVAGKRNIDIRQYLKDNSHVHDLNDAWFYRIRSSEEIQDLFCRQTLEAVQEGCSRRAKRLRVLYAGVDELLKNIGILTDDFRELHVNDELAANVIERKECGTSLGASGGVSGSIINVLNDSSISLPEHNRLRRDNIKGDVLAWTMICSLLNQIRIEVADYEKNVIAAKHPCEEEIEAMVDERAKSKLNAILESFEAQVDDHDRAVEAEQA